MHSIRTRITIMAIAFMAAAMIVAAVSGVIAIKDIGKESAEQTLLLLCETGEKNLDSYFDSVEQSVEMVSAYVESDLDGIDDAHLQAHLDRVSDIFKKLTYKTNGVLTYYYRIDPTVSTTAKGFWFVRNENEGFLEHEVTDITQYDTSDTSKLVWFTVPKYNGEAVWLPPYITDNLGAKVISYNVPVYYEKQFIGVIGIEIDYFTMAELVDSIALYENGYAFINDKDGYIVYHPRMSEKEYEENRQVVPTGLNSEKAFVTYTYNGVEKEAVWRPMSNGMRFNVSVPVSEINAAWHRWIAHMLIVFAVILAALIFAVTRFAKHITGPLRKLTEAAIQVDNGDYNVNLDSKDKDEVGILTRSFVRLIRHLRVYISDLNDLAYADSLTSLHNKGAFDICVKNLQTQVNEPEGVMKFAICIFDCNDLKKVNDQNGHDKGDIYLQEAAAIICEVFGHSPVFRIGGDEFAAILMDHDYERRDELIKLFDEKCAEKRESQVSWEKLDVARGMAIYNPREDDSISDVVRRADRLMYENKWKIKADRAADGTAVSENNS